MLTSALRELVKKTKIEIIDEFNVILIFECVTSSQDCP